ncbi:MAG: FxsB family cyclophane-forming radical SAM/SPASM peptide maturase [Trebonia sp.]
MTLTRRAKHPAPWPLLDLDVAKIRAAGHQAVPFRQFILKVHSRCNLSCSYCYVYEMADSAWRTLPRRMSPAVVAKAVERIGDHVAKHGLASVDVILHGGEPLLAGAEWLAGLVDSLRASVRAEVNVAVQTNGTLLDRPMLNRLKSLGVGIGVSLDGDTEATGRHRRYANGRNSYDAVAAGLDLLRSPEFLDCYSGILCTIDVENDPLSTYEALLKFSPPALDLLLPHANHSSAPPGKGYADWLIGVFERWYSAPRQETRIRLFSEIIQLVLGLPGEVEGIGLLPSTVVVVDTDGSIKQLDSLSSTYPGAADTGLDVMSGSFDEALDHPTTVARQIGADALSPQCLDCEVMEICGGGLYPHRFRDGDGFRNPSVYCEDLREVITHVRDRVVADLSLLSSSEETARSMP